MYPGCSILLSSVCEQAHVPKQRCNWRSRPMVGDFPEQHVTGRELWGRRFLRGTRSNLSLTKSLQPSLLGSKTWSPTVVCVAQSGFVGRDFQSCWEVGIRGPPKSSKETSQETCWSAWHATADHVGSGKNPLACADSKHWKHYDRFAGVLYIAIPVLVVSEHAVPEWENQAANPAGNCAKLEG